MMLRKAPSVVLVGRPNVGKSTLFNRMTGSRRAIVAPLAGTTRDSLARPVVWRGVDVPALRYRRHVRRQPGSAARSGRRAGPAGDRRAPISSCWSSTAAKAWSAGDETIAGSCARPAGRSSWRSTRSTTSGRATSSMEFYQLGHRARSSRFRPSTAPAWRSCSMRSWNWDSRPRGLGLGGRRGRLDVQAPSPQPPAPEHETAIAIVGRPNVGKSSLVNRLLREERVLVSDMPGTTRDAIDSAADLAPAPVPHRGHGRHAAARHASRSGGAVEMVSVAGAKKAIADADVVALVIDAAARRDAIRTRRSAAKPIAPAAASSSSRTSGIS